MLLGLPGAVWVVLGIEFVERLGYYAVAFSLFTYCTVMLNTGSSVANALINAIYICIPAAAFLASGVADSSVGRPRVLAASLVVYTVSLFLLFLSACPAFYADFPKQARTSGKVLFGMALLFFSFGYGSMKVCTNPIMADCVVLHYRGCLTGPEEEDKTGTGETTEGLSTHPRSHPRAEVGVTGAAAEPSAPPLATQLREEGEAVAMTSASRCEEAEETDTSFAYGATAVKGTAVVEAFVSNSSLSQTPFSTTTTATPAPQQLLHADEQVLQQALARLFVYAYWFANVGGLIGSFAAPLLRNLESTRVHAGSETHTTGYYYSFLLAAVSVGTGGVFLYHWYAWLPRNAPAPNYVLVRVLVAAAVKRWQVLCGARVLAHTDGAACPPRDWLDYACAELRDPRAGAAASDVTVVDREWHSTGNSSTAVLGIGAAATAAPPLRASRSEDDVTTAGWVADCRTTLRVCKAFVALPIYWLICNQFSTNLMYTAAAVELPASIPEELFNNINTVTMLLFLALWDQWLLPRVLHNRVPSARLRIVAGFLCMCASMLWCGLVQCGVTSRGYYDREGVYVLRSGRQKLSSGWLVMPYVLQGFASALVDPTVMEVAYRDAPTRMKGTVMGLYWVASSASGFLGLLLSPVMKPQNATTLYFSFAVAQLAVSGLFFVVNGGC